MVRVYKSSNVGKCYKEQKSSSGFIPSNIIMVICCSCGGLYEEEVLGVNCDYESVSVCSFCGNYNSI